MKVSVVGIDRVNLLVRLYNNANCLGNAYDIFGLKETQSDTSDALRNRAEAAKLVSSGQTRFDYVNLGDGLRPIKITLADEIDTKDYDDHNGEGLGLAVIKALRAESDDAVEALRQSLCMHSILSHRSFSAQFQDYEEDVEEQEDIPSHPGFKRARLESA